MTTHSSKQTILQLCHSYYDPFADCARQYAALFKNTPYQVVTVFLSGKEDPEITSKVDSDTVIFLGYESRQLTGLKSAIIKDISRISKQYNFDFCIAHRIKPTYIALLATKLPVLSVQHTFGCFDRWNRRLLVNIFSSRINILTVSNALRDEVRARLPKWPEAAISTLYNHIDEKQVREELLSKTDARRALNLSHNAWIIGNVGRLHPDKDQDTLITAFAHAQGQLPDTARLVLIGKGRLEAKLKTRCKELGISDRVIFTGPVPSARRYFRAFDSFVLSSDREPFGMVLLEAMAAGIPIICTDCGGGGEIIKPIGQVFSFGDSESLAALLIEQVLSEHQLTQDYTSYLEQNFTDNAVRQKFWSTQYPVLKNRI